MIFSIRLFVMNLHGLLFHSVQQLIPLLADGVDLIIFFFNQRGYFLCLPGKKLFINEPGQDPAEKAGNGKHNAQQDHRRLRRHRKGGSGHERRPKDADNQSPFRRHRGLCPLQIVDLFHSGFKIPLQEGALHFI